MTKRKPKAPRYSQQKVVLPPPRPLLDGEGSEGQNASVVHWQVGTPEQYNLPGWKIIVREREFGEPAPYFAHPLYPNCEFVLGHAILLDRMMEIEYSLQQIEKMLPGTIYRRSETDLLNRVVSAVETYSKEKAGDV